MLEKGRPNEKTAIRARLRAGAERDALDAVTRYSELRGEQALHVARHTVAAAAPKLRAEHVARLANLSDREAIASGVSLVATLALDVAAYLTIFRRGTTKDRVLAGVGIAAHVVLVGHSRWREATVRKAARAQFAQTDHKTVRAAA